MDRGEPSTPAGEEVAEAVEGLVRVTASRCRLVQVHLEPSALRMDPADLATQFCAAANAALARTAHALDAMAEQLVSLRERSIREAAILTQALTDARRAVITEGERRLR